MTSSTWKAAACAALCIGVASYAPAAAARDQAWGNSWSNADSWSGPGGYSARESGGSENHWSSTRKRTHAPKGWDWPSAFPDSHYDVNSPDYWPRPKTDWAAQAATLIGAAAAFQQASQPQPIPYPGPGAPAAAPSYAGAPAAPLPYTGAGELPAALAAPSPHAGAGHPAVASGPAPAPGTAATASTTIVASRASPSAAVTPGLAGAVATRGQRSQACHASAVNHSGFDPAAASAYTTAVQADSYARALNACLDAPAASGAGSL